MSSLIRKTLGLLILVIPVSLFGFLLYLVGKEQDRRDLYDTCLTMDTKDNCLKALYPDMWQEELARQEQVLKLLKKTK